MRYAFAACLVLPLLLTTFSASADVGPRPPCPPGTYHAYWYGHHCVPNGYHLERDPEGGVTEVEDGKSLDKPEPVAPIASTEFATPPSTIAKNPEPPPLAASAAPESATTPSVVAPPPQRGCTCGVPGLTEEKVGAGFVFATMLFAAGRRIRLHRQTHNGRSRRER